MYYYIYKITNINTQKSYIGSHRTNNLDDGYFGSGIYLKRAIAKHGIESFKKDILQFCTSVDELHQRETEILQQLQHTDLYNLKYCALGGNTRAKYSHTDKQKYIHKLVSNPNSPIGKKGCMAFNYGKKASVATREKQKQRKRLFLQTASAERLNAWKANVISKCKPRCKIMSEINCKAVRVQNRSTNEITTFRSKTDCAAYFGVHMGRLTKYIKSQSSDTSEATKVFHPFIITLALSKAVTEN